MKVKNPYTRLLEEIREWCCKLLRRDKREMWFYPKKQLNDGWPLTDLYERVSAAKQLGYDVVLEANEMGLIVKYIKQIPNIPSTWRI